MPPHCVASALPGKQNNAIQTLISTVSAFLKCVLEFLTHSLTCSPKLLYPFSNESINLHLSNNLSHFIQKSLRGFLLH